MQHPPPMATGAEEYDDDEVGAADAKAPAASLTVANSAAAVVQHLDKAAVSRLQSERSINRNVSSLKSIPKAGRS